MYTYYTRTSDCINFARYTLASSAAPCRIFFLFLLSDETKLQRRLRRLLARMKVGLDRLEFVSRTVVYPRLAREFMDAPLADRAISARKFMENARESQDVLLKIKLLILFQDI